MIPPELLLLFKISGLFYLSWNFLWLFFHMKFSIVLSWIVKNCVWMLMRIAMNIKIVFSRMAIFMLLFLLICQCVWFFMFWYLCSASFFIVLQFLSWKIFMRLIRVTHRYFKSSVVIVISCSIPLPFVYMKTTDSLELIIYPATSQKMFIDCYNSMVEFLWLLMYIIISSLITNKLTSFPFCIPLISLV